MARKTYPVADLVDRVNRMVASTEGTAGERRGLITLLEGVLHDTGNYRGFAYLPSELREDGTLKTNYDDTRRRYDGGN